jgi:hypothetical protein
VPSHHDEEISYRVQLGQCRENDGDDNKGLFVFGFLFVPFFYDSSSCLAGVACANEFDTFDYSRSPRYSSSNDKLTV